jgi:hypothetical protein
MSWILPKRETTIQSVGFLIGEQGAAWGGDLDGNNNNVKIQQHNTTGTDANRVGMHIQSNSNTVHVGQGCSFESSSDTTCESSSAVRIWWSHSQSRFTLWG